MRVSVDQDVCCGSGNCVLTVPDVFDQRDSDGIVVLRQAQPAAELHERVRDAAWTCPSGAIRFDEDDG